MTDIKPKAFPYPLPLEVEVAGDFIFLLICLVAGPFFLGWPLIAPFLGLEFYSRPMAINLLITLLGLVFLWFPFYGKVLKGNRVIIDEEGVIIPVHFRRRRFYWGDMDKVETYTWYKTECIGFLTKSKALRLKQTTMNTLATGLYDAAIPLEKIRRKERERVVATILDTYARNRT